MSGLPTSAARALDAALVSLAAFQAVDHLVRTHPDPASLSELVLATGLHVGEVARAISALAGRGVLVAEGGTVQLAPTYADALLAAWRRLAVDTRLRRRALTIAADRETAAGRMVMRIAWAVSPPGEPGPLAASAPAVPAPRLFAGPTAPVA